MDTSASSAAAPPSPRVAVTQIGEGRPVVLLHGWLLSGRVEQADLEPAFASAPGWRRLYVDLPGMGDSPVLSGRTSMDHILEVTQSTIHDLLGNEPYAVAGMSAGANLARALAHRHPQTVRGLLMRVPMLVAGDADRRLPSAPDTGALTAMTSQAADEKERVLWEAERDRATQPALMEIRDDPRRYGLNDPTAGGTRFERPTLVVAGRQDVTVGYADAVDVLGCYPHATLAVLDQGDHRLPVPGQAALFEALVRDWLRRVAEVW